MGTLDTHWCNVCKRTLDKKKDRYVEFELVNQPFMEKVKSKLRLKPKKPKGIICEDCINKNSALKKAVELMVKAGNPLFKAVVTCHSAGKCENFTPSKRKGVNCTHISVIGDKIYCNRSHVGSLKLPREKAEVRREEGHIVMKMLKKYVKDPKTRKLLNVALLEKDFLQHLYVPPSTVIEKTGVSTD